MKPAHAAMIIISGLGMSYANADILSKESGQPSDNFILVSSDTDTSTSAPTTVVDAYGNLKIVPRGSMAPDNKPAYAPPSPPAQSTQNNDSTSILQPNEKK